MCFRLGKRGLVPGGYAVKVKSDGTVLVLRRAGRRWEVEYARAQPRSASRTGRRPARDPGRVHLVTVNDLFRVRGTRVACEVAHEARRLAVQCGLVDARGRLPTASAVGAVLRQDGMVAAVTFDENRRPTTVFRSGGGATTGGMVTLALDASTRVELAGRGLAHMGCGAVVFQGNRTLTCYRSDDVGEPTGYSFAIVQDGTVVVFDRVAGELKAVFVAPGRGLGPGKRNEVPTEGDTFGLEVGEHFKLAGTLIICGLERVQRRLAITCGVADAEGIGAARTNAVRLEESGRVTVVRIDAHRKPRAVFRGISPNAP